MTVLTDAGVRCRDLDRYLKRLAKHPTVRKDPDFRLEFCNFDMDDRLDIHPQQSKKAFTL